jgi:hypothetical protein
MKHDRELLLNSLERLKPALGRGNIPELQHFWCDGKKVAAYDGGIGIRADLSTEFKGGVPGAVLLGLLGGSHIKEAVFNGPDKANAVGVSMGKAHAKLPLLPYDRQPWPFPPKVPTDAWSMNVTEGLFQSVKQVLLVKSAAPTRAEHHAVIFYTTNKGVYLYTTDDMSVARAYVAGIKLPDDKPVLIPRQFLEQVVKQCEVGTRLSVLKDCVLADGEELQIGSHMMEASDVLDLDALIAPYLKGEKPTPIPDGLKEALGRAQVVGGKSALVKVSCEGSTMTVSGRYDYGEYTEDIQLDKPVDGEVIARADLLLNLLPEVDSFSITDDASLVLRGQNALVYVLAGAEGS